MYQIGDKVVHPMYGAGVLESIVQRKIDGVERDYYMMKLPTEHSEDIGVRPVVDANQADQVMAAIPSIQAEMTSNWNRRYRENMERLKSGDLFQVAWVIKGLTARDHSRGLSTGERKMLHSARQMLISEIVLSKSLSYETVEEQLDTALA